MALKTWRAIVARLALLVVRVLAWARPIEIRFSSTRRFVLAKDGRMIPVAAGGAPDEDGEDRDADGDESGGDGESGATSRSGRSGDEARDDEDGADRGGSGENEPDWRRESRKHERRSKAEKRRADDLAAQLKDYQDQDKSERDRAVEDALRRGRDEALAEADRERRADRLEIAVTRLAAKGVKVGDGDDIRTVRFDDPEDALVFIERAIARGDLDIEDVFDDRGRVKQDAIEEELIGLLGRKPKLAAEAPETRRRDPGEIDAGKGKGAGRSVEELSVEDHVRRLAK